MKKGFTLISCICLSFSLLQGQVVLTNATHGLKEGDTHASQKVQFNNTGAAGQGQVWDFSDLTPIGDAETSSISVENGNGYNTTASRSSDKAIFLYNNTEEVNEYKGYKISDFLISYDRPVVKTMYPQSFGAHFDGSFEGKMIYNGKSTGQISGTYSTHADAEGTIILPDGITLPVLRVKTTERTTQWACSNQVTETEKYLWYSQDTRYPVFVSIITTTESLSDKSVKVAKHSYLNTKVEQPQLKNAQDVTSDIAYTVSPNPFRDNITINYDLPREMKVSIDLYSMQGLKLTTILPSEVQEGSQSITYNILPYTQTEKVFFVKIQLGEKIYSEKIIKAN